MVVQAQYPSNLIPDIQNSQELFCPNYYATSMVDDCKLSSPPEVSHVAQHQPLLHSVVPCIAVQPGTAAGLIHPSGTDVPQQVLGTRKRIRESVDLLSGQQLPLLSLGENRQNRAASSLMQQSSGLVSTGLRLAYDDEHVSTVTTAAGRTETGSTVLHTIFEDVSVHLHRQQVEFDHFFTTQVDRFRKGLEERRQRHAKALLASIEGILSKRLKGQEMEVETANRRNIELEDQVKRLSFEACTWQNKAKINEAMITALRSNLQHAVVHNREQSKEGHGYSDAEDAASANDNKNMETQVWAMRSNRDANKDLPRACKICRTGEVCILLLPCRHLCSCKGCEGSIERCPICQCLKSASVEVYTS
eukprot:c23359_g2_i1 orf=358-1443(-)